MKKVAKKPLFKLWKRIKTSMRAGSGSVVLQNDHSVETRN